MNGSYALARSRGYTTGTIFIQGPSIVLPVWRCIMFNGSYALALGRDTKPGHHALVHPDSRRENLIFCTNHIPRNESSKYAPTESFGGQITSPLLLANGSYALVLGRDTKQFWGLNNKPSTSCHWFLCFGTRPRHQTRAPCLGPPRLKKGKSNFFTNHISYTLLRMNH